MQSLNKLSKREKILGLTTILVITGVVFKFWFLSNATEINQLERKINSVTLQMENNKRILGELKKRKIASEPSEPINSDIQKYVDKNKRFANLIHQITKSESGDSFTINKMAVDEQRQSKDFTRNSLRLELEGSFLKIGSFLADLESSLSLAEVREIDISRISYDLKRCTAKISLDTYVLKELE